MEDRSNTRVVVLFPGALGDLLLAHPALRALRTRHAGAHVTLAVNGWLRAFAASGGAADATVSLDDADAAGLFGGTRVPSWFGHRPELYAWIGTRDPAAGARLRSLSHRAALFAVVRDDGPEHASREYLGQVGAGTGGARAWPVLPATPRLLELCGRRPVLAVHPGAGAVAKRWPAAGFRALVHRWQSAGGVAVEIVGPAETAIAPLGCAHRLEEAPLLEVAGFLSRVDGYVGNDSGISHLAAAVGARGVAMFGPTPARRWAPGAGIVAVDTNGAFADDAETNARAVARAWGALGEAGCLDKVGGRT